MLIPNGVRKAVQEVDREVALLAGHASEEGPRTWPRSAWPGGGSWTSWCSAALPSTASAHAAGASNDPDSSRGSSGAGVPPGFRPVRVGPGRRPDGRSRLPEIGRSSHVMAMCPMSVPGTQVRADDVEGGESLTFTTTGSVADSREAGRGHGQGAQRAARRHRLPGAPDGRGDDGIRKCR